MLNLGCMRGASSGVESIESRAGGTALMSEGVATKGGAQSSELHWHRCRWRFISDARRSHILRPRADLASDFRAQIRALRGRLQEVREEVGILPGAARVGLHPQDAWLAECHASPVGGGARCRLKGARQCVAAYTHRAPSRTVGNPDDGGMEGQLDERPREGSRLCGALCEPIGLHRRHAVHVTSLCRCCVLFFSPLSSAPQFKTTRGHTGEAALIPPRAA